jgi:hypothetical protein
MAGAGCNPVSIFDGVTAGGADAVCSGLRQSNWEAPATAPIPNTPNNATLTITFTARAPDPLNDLPRHAAHIMAGELRRMGPAPARRGGDDRLAVVFALNGGPDEILSGRKLFQPAVLAPIRAPDVSASRYSRAPSIKRARENELDGVIC